MQNYAVYAEFFTGKELRSKKIFVGDRNQCYDFFVNNKNITMDGRHPKNPHVLYRVHDN